MTIAATVEDLAFSAAIPGRTMDWVLLAVNTKPG